MKRKPGNSVLDRQFGHPSGVLGKLVGVAMAMEHKALHQAAVNRLALTSRDRVLEIGFGPGTAIKLASAQAESVAGIEPSAEMVAQARRRNQPGIRSGRVEVRQASAEAIPFPGDSFSVLFEINSFAHWVNQEAGLKEAFRVLETGGRLLMVLRRGGSDVKSMSEGLEKMLACAGFTQVRFEEHQLGHGGAFVNARK